ncbi:hypothetical protein M1271_00870 [Patescibacteria group bacterium]|nr:hypothetical protein [Patescibacteria group bacterium]
MERKIIVVKIGSSVIIEGKGKLCGRRLSHIVDQLVKLRQEGFAPILVLSGAVGCGMRVFFQKQVESDKMSKQAAAGVGQSDKMSKQAAAGVGQVEMMQILAKLARRRGVRIAQILMTKYDFKYAAMRGNIRKVLRLYMQNGVVPVLNENDVLDLNSFGGNDFLAGEIAKLFGKSRLLILSSWEGSLFGVGGGEAKETVKNSLIERGIKTCILDGREKNIILRSILS